LRRQYAFVSLHNELDNLHFKISSLYVPEIALPKISCARNDARFWWSSEELDVNLRTSRSAIKRFEKDHHLFNVE
jgi:hypothetical protein